MRSGTLFSLPMQDIYAISAAILEDYDAYFTAHESFL